MATKQKNFKDWYGENRTSVLLNDEYSDYKHEMKEYGDGVYLTFKEWMKDKFEYLQTH